MLAAVVAVGICARRNPTAVALAVSYFFLQAAWLLAGTTPRLSFLVDLSVIALIIGKPPARDCYPYKSWLDQLFTFWCEKSLWDRLVLAIFPLMWCAYLLPPYYAWFALYWLFMAQLFAAGGEVLQHRLHARAAKAGSTPDLGMKFVLGEGYG